MIVEAENVRPVILSAISKNGKILSFEEIGKKEDEKVSDPFSFPYPTRLTMM